MSDKLDQEIFSAASLVQKKPENKLRTFSCKKNKSRALLDLKNINFPLRVIIYTIEYSFAKILGMMIT